MEQPLMIELMGEGFAIERDPVPVAGIMATGAAAEAILQRLSETDGEAGEDGERFTPYALTGEPEDIYGGIQIVGGDVEGAKDFIRKLIGAVERPGDEGAADTRSEAEQPGQEQAAGRGKAAMLALRRSRLARIASGTAIVTAGALNWVSPASGESLRQECIREGLIMPKLEHAYMLHPGRTGAYNSQLTKIGATYNVAKPEECDDYIWIRKGWVEMKTTDRHVWKDITIPWVDTSGDAPRYDSGYGETNGHLGDWFFWKPDRKVRAVLENIVEDTDTHKVLATKDKYARVQIVHHKSNKH
jgi:hypothetical protein